MDRILRAVSLLVAVAAIGLPQSSVPAEFDVASVKIARDANDYGKGLTAADLTPNSVSLRNYTLRDCVQWAYHVSSYQIAGPGASGSERYDIAAKTAGPTHEDQLRRMMQALLADRFKLVLHRETKDLPVYLLTAAKNGPKLQPTKVDASGATRVVDGSFIYEHLSMEEFASRISNLRGVERPVLDRTGIEGLYDFAIKFADSNKDMKLAMRDGDTPSVFRLLTEQLGLKLESGKAPIDMLVIDHVEKVPTEN